jgi:hypothetical protein
MINILSIPWCVCVHAYTHPHTQLLQYVLGNYRNKYFGNSGSNS